MRRVASSFALLTAAASIACANDAAIPPPAKRATATGAFRVSAEPTLIIGAADRAEQINFTTITNLFRLPSGVFVVTNHIPPEVYTFSSDGKLLAAFGGEAQFFGLHAPMTYDNGRIFVGAGDAFRVDEYSPDGRHVRTYQKEYRRRAVTKLDMEAEAERLRADVPTLQRELYLAELRQELRETPHAAEMPAMGGYIRMTNDAQAIVLDDAGALWVLEYLGPRDPEARWTVFAPDGTIAGTVSVPRGFWIKQVGTNCILGIHRDDDGVETVRMYDLQRG